MNQILQKRMDYNIMHLFNSNNKIEPVCLMRNSLKLPIFEVDSPFKESNCISYQQLGFNL